MTVTYRVVVGKQKDALWIGTRDRGSVAVFCCSISFKVLLTCLIY